MRDSRGGYQLGDRLPRPATGLIVFGIRGMSYTVPLAFCMFSGSHGDRRENNSPRHRNDDRRRLRVARDESASCVTAMHAKLLIVLVAHWRRRRAPSLRSLSPSDAAPPHRAICSSRPPRSRCRSNVLRATSKRWSSIGSSSGIGRGPAARLCSSMCHSAAWAPPTRPPARAHCRSSACAAPTLARAAATTCTRPHCASSKAGTGRLPKLRDLPQMRQCGGGLARHSRYFGWTDPRTRRRGKHPTGH